MSSVHGGTVIPRFLQCDEIFEQSIFVDQASLEAAIVGINLATHENDASILIQPSGHPKDSPVRLSAEEAAKAPLRPLQGSGDSANVTNSPGLPRFTKLD